MKNLLNSSIKNDLKFSATADNTTKYIQAYPKLAKAVLCASNEKT